MCLAWKMMKLGTLLIIAAAFVSQAGATTLMRTDLEKLTIENELIVVAEVLDSYSYWNDEGTFILTDIRLAPTEVLRGTVESKEVMITLMGGTVGELSTIIVGGAELDPGSSYVFVSQQRESARGR